MPVRPVGGGGGPRSIGSRLQKLAPDCEEGGRDRGPLAPRTFAPVLCKTAIATGACAPALWPRGAVT